MVRNGLVLVLIVFSGESEPQFFGGMNLITQYYVSTFCTRQHLFCLLEFKCVAGSPLSLVFMEILICMSKAVNVQFAECRSDRSAERVEKTKLKAFFFCHSE